MCLYFELEIIKTRIILYGYDCQDLIKALQIYRNVKQTI